ncbi:MAG: sulfate adenylyltransferase [Candidatus Aminicenantes bacterium]|nr:sulfate adenylyltransferase [Candidatus Aminicenantes bacterium]NLH77191.1 sulfate adenylyltransferase [Acidobacteriota bacterium]
MIQPHGGKLIDRTLEGKKKDAALAAAGRMPRLTVEAETVSDLENIATGVYSPLQGFLGEVDFKSVLAGSRLSSDVPWTVPIVLDADEGAAGKLKIGDEILLAAEDGRPVAVLHLEEKYGYDRGETAEKVFGTRDPAHPGVAKVLGLKDVLLAGAIDLIEASPTPFDRWKLAPKETRVLFESKGWKTVVAFQTRNTPHLGHEYLQKAALTFTDGLFINPVIGKKKKGDFKDEVILASYEEAIRRYYVKDRTALAILQMEMRYAGPREAIHHAILRKNFGCTHIIIGRDHAGVGSYYAPFAAQDIFEAFPDLGIAPMFFRSFSWCRTCGAVVNEKICPHPPAEHVQFSGTKIRDLLVKGECPPAELMRPEVAEVIMRFKEPFND